jgi:hypothetical protein
VLGVVANLKTIPKRLHSIDIDAGKNSIIEQ